MTVLDLARDLSEAEMEDLVEQLFLGDVSEEREMRLVEQLEAADVTLREDAVELNPAFRQLEEVLGLEPSEPAAGPLPGEPKPEDGETPIRQRTQAQAEARQRVIDLIEANMDDVEVLLDLAVALEQTDASRSGLLSQQRLETLLDGDREDLADRARRTARQAEPLEVADFPDLQRALRRGAGRDVTYFENVIAELQGDREASTLAGQGVTEADLEELRELHPTVVEAAVERARDAISGLEGDDEEPEPDMPVQPQQPGVLPDELVEASITSRARQLVPGREREDWLDQEPWTASEDRVQLERQFMTWVLKTFGGPRRWDVADFKLRPENRDITMAAWARGQVRANNATAEDAINAGLPPSWFEGLGNG